MSKKRKGTYTDYSRSKRTYSKGAYLQRRLIGPSHYLRARNPRRMRPTNLGYGRFRNARTGGFLGIELKFLDCAWNGVAIAPSTDGSGGEIQPSSGCTDAISIPAQGDGEQQRDGRKFTIKSIWVSGSITTTALSDQADASDQAGYWIALVLDTQANGATIVSENMYINPSTVAVSMMPQPLRNLENSKRFRVLQSKFVRPGGMYAMNDATGASGTASGSLSNQTQPTFNLSWKGNIVTNCKTGGTTADVASTADNAIHLIGYSGSSALTPLINAKSRMRFVG